MIKPARLKKGDKVAIVSLSSGIAGDTLFYHRYELGKKRLEDNFGLNVITMPNALLGSEELYLHPELRAKDLMDAFKDKEIKAIFCNLGGDDTVRLLPYIDYEIIKNNPKIFMGYSDTTINHFMLQKAGIVSYYGPCVMAELAENVEMHKYTEDNMYNILFNDTTNYVIDSSMEWTNEVLDWTNKEGELLGGCIDTFHMFIGSEIWPRENLENKILFLETSEDKPTPEFISQIFRNPLMVEMLNKVKGMIIGKPHSEKYYEEYKNAIINTITKELKLNNIFIGYNYNFGHSAPMCVLPIGIKVRISSKDGKITLLESATN